MLARIDISILVKASYRMCIYFYAFRVVIVPILLGNGPKYPSAERVIDSQTKDNL